MHDLITGLTWTSDITPCSPHPHPHPQLQPIPIRPQAGYSALEVVQGGVGHPWNLRRAGYGLQELADLGMSADELRQVGFGVPEAQAVDFLGTTMAKLVLTDTRRLPTFQGGTTDPKWHALLHGGGHETGAKPGAAATAAGSGAQGVRALQGLARVASSVAHSGGQGGGQPQSAVLTASPSLVSVAAGAGAGAGAASSGASRLPSMVHSPSTVQVS